MLELDNHPLKLALTRDAKRVLVTMPYETWVVHAATLSVEKTIELPFAHPSVFEAEDDGELWFGGGHLRRGSLWGNKTNKAGTKLGGVVDRVCVVRPRLLCGVGTTGEVLWNTDQEAEVHRRKVAERPVHGLVSTVDGRAVFADGGAHVWVIDPDHASGYMKLKFKHAGAPDTDAVVCVHVDARGRCLLGARDGAVAWTNRTLRIKQQYYVRNAGVRAPLALDSCARWLYALRDGSTLDRFAFSRDDHDADDSDPLPPAQTARLPRPTTCLACTHDGLLLAGPHADNQLGRLWNQDPQGLTWQPLRLGTRQAAPAHADEPPRKPDFTQVRSRVQGPPLKEFSVDRVLAPGDALWLARTSGQLLDRAFASVSPDAVLQSDTLVLPAMMRLREGTARPGLVLWPGARDRPEALTLLTWGDNPRGWLTLETPSLRNQGWSRQDVFPLIVALSQRPPQVPGVRPRLPKRWLDPELFRALAKECKSQLKVLW